MLIFIPNNSLNEQDPECQAQQKAEAAGGREVTEGNTWCCQGIYWHVNWSNKLRAVKRKWQTRSSSSIVKKQKPANWKTHQAIRNSAAWNKTTTKERCPLCTTKKKAIASCTYQQITRIIEWKKQQEREPVGNAAERSWPTLQTLFETKSIFTIALCSCNADLARKRTGFQVLKTLCYYWRKWDIVIGIRLLTTTD